jgi:hypothetical protein
VGMDRLPVGYWPLSRHSPHRRGDGPVALRRLGVSQPFSPQTWGWTALVLTLLGSVVILPTDVGMDRLLQDIQVGKYHSPHRRGDGPDGSSGTLTERLFSPQTWGWTGVQPHHSASPGILPTDVGMDRGRKRT